MTLLMVYLLGVCLSGLLSPLLFSHRSGADLAAAIMIAVTWPFWALLVLWLGACEVLDWFLP